MLRRLLAAAVLLAATLITAGSAAEAGPNSCDSRVNNTIEKLLECVDVDNVREHQAALQAIADANGSTRDAGSPGYVASRDYVAGLLEDAGYEVTIQEFEFAYFSESTPAVLEQVSPNQVAYPLEESGGFASMTYSGGGDVTAPTQAVDFMIPPGAAPNTSSSGCEPEDFDGFTAGNIAVLQRGSCSFALKAINAEAAGASAVVIANEGQPEREDYFFGTLGGPAVSIPVVGTAYAVGVELGAEGVVARVAVDAVSEIRTTENVIADSPWGDVDNTVMVGAHLDSVPEGPGINDNGSGSAAILETALQLAKTKTRNHLRFAWWGAEEFGLLGSEHYVGELTEGEADQIALYLNFDMVGSPNYFFGIYDGDDSDAVGNGAGPEGSAQIEQTFIDYFEMVGEPYQGTDFSGRSDYGPFIAIGIPAGGLFTGAEGIKTAAEAEIYGGTAGVAYDACYHLACDTFDNNSMKALTVNSDAIAYATLNYAMSTELINGEKSKGNFKPSNHGPHHHNHDAEVVSS